MTTLVWFREDLRIADNPALAFAAARGAVVPVYVLDGTDTVRAPGAASRWWLHHSLSALSRDLGGLVLLRGDPAVLLADLARRTAATAVVWNRLYDGASIARDSTIKAGFLARGIEARSFNGALLHEPWEVTTGAGGPFKVFTPFWRACLGRETAAPLGRPDVTLAPTTGPCDRLEDWGLRPARPDWAEGWDRFWTPGEAGAQARLDAFLETGLKNYADGRDRPDLAQVSRLSPHLHFGEISPRQVCARVRFEVGRDPSLQRDADKFLAEIGWREFSHHLLHQFPDLATRNWKPAFDAFPWRESAADLRAWQRGLTGYPLVDAAMRELWNTGFLHNRARMVAASFLVKHLRLDWRAGEAWFWDTLVDADAANNAAGWQWVAGSGADAAPYFRIFNPVAQGERFDPEGAYVRRWCPELAALETRFIHRPFEAPHAVLDAARVRLGETYPWPIVDHAAARKAALEAYEMARRAGHA